MTRFIHKKKTKKNCGRPPAGPEGTGKRGEGVGVGKFTTTVSFGQFDKTLSNCKITVEELCPYV